MGYYLDYYSCFRGGAWSLLRVTLPELSSSIWASATPQCWLGPQSLFSPPSTHCMLKDPLSPSSAPKYHGFPRLHLQTRSDLGMSLAGCLVDTAEPVPLGALGGFSLKGVNPASCACGWPWTWLFLLSPPRACAPARPKIYAYVIRQGIEMAMSTWRAPQEKTDNVKTHVSNVSRATGTPRTRRRGEKSGPWQREECVLEELACGCGEERSPGWERLHGLEDVSVGAFQA